MPYIGRSTEAFGVRTRYTFTPSAGDTSVSGADVNGLSLSFTDGAYVDVFLNGVRLKHNTDYVTTTANTIGSLAALAASDEVEVVVFDVFSLADMVSSANGGNFFGQVNFKTDGAVLGLLLCNNDTSQRTVDVKIESDTNDTETNETVFVTKDTPIPATSSLELLAGNKVVLQATDVLKIDSDVAGKIDATLSIMEIT